MKKLLIAAGVVLASLGLFVLLAPQLVTIETVRRALAHEVAGWSGKALTFEGTPTVSFSPYLMVTFPNVTIGSTKDQTPLVVMQSLSAELKVLPLFYGGVEASSLEFQNPSFRFVVDANGRPNWALPKVLVGTSDLASLVIRDGNIDYADASGAKIALEHIDATLGWPDPNAAAVIKGNATWKGEAIDFNGSLGDPTSLIAGTAVPFRLAVASTPLRVAFNGTLSQPDGLQAAGSLSLTTPSVRRIATLFGRQMTEGSTLGAASVTADANLTRRFLTLANAKFSLDGNEGEGAFGIDMSAPRPALQGTLDFDRLDLSAYSEAIQAAIANARATPDRLLGLGVLDDNDIDLRVSAGEVAIGAARFEKAAASAAVRDGRLDISVGEAQLDGGHLSAGFAATLHDNTIKASLQTRIDGVAMKSAMTDLFGVSAVDGTGNGTLALNTTGSTWNELVTSLDGKAEGTITGGTVTGINLGALARLGAGGAGDGNLLDGSLMSGSTPFTQAGGRFTIAADRMRADAVSMTGTGFTVAFSGEAPLQAASISGRGLLDVTRADPAAPRLSVPFAIGGTWLAPTIVPDFSALSRRTALEPVQKSGFVVRLAERLFPSLR